MRIHPSASFIQVCGFLVVATLATILGCTSGSSSTSMASGSPAPQPPAVSPPVLSPPPGSFTDSVSISISSRTPGTLIYYTRDGTNPTSASTPYTDPLVVTPQSVAKDELTGWDIRAIAVAGGVASTVVRGFYSMSYSQDPKPTLSPTAGAYTSPQLVTITSFAASADINYTLDGSEPSYFPGGSTYRYVAPIPIDKTTTIKAKTVAYYSETPATTATYTF